MKNNKLILALLILCFGFQMANAQKFELPAFKKGDIVINGGIGFLPTANSKNVSSVVPPLSLSASYRVTKNVAVGAFAAYGSSKFRSDLPSHAVIPRSSDSNQLMVGVRASVHYDVNKTSFYGGLMLGYNREAMVTDIPVTDNDNLPQYPTVTKGKAVYSAFLGAQHMLTNHLGVYGEVGYGISIFNLGFTLKL